MFEITVTGDTYPMRKALTQQKYRWNVVKRSWSKIVSEAALDKECDAIRPVQSYSDIKEPNIIIELTKVDINGNPLSPDVMRVHLRSMARPGDARISDVFKEEVSVITVPPIQASSGPINPKKKNSMDGFF